MPIVVLAQQSSGHWVNVHLWAFMAHIYLLICSCLCVFKSKMLLCLRCVSLPFGHVRRADTGRRHLCLQPVVRIHCCSIWKVGSLPLVLHSIFTLIMCVCVWVVDPEGCLSLFICSEPQTGVSVPRKATILRRHLCMCVWLFGVSG